MPAIDLSPYLNAGIPIAKTKIRWRVLPGKKLQAFWQPGISGYEIGITDSDMDAVQQWCQDVNCGRRTSFDTWQFSTREEITMFLLRWSGA